MQALLLGSPPQSQKVWIIKNIQAQEGENAAPPSFHLPARAFGLYRVKSIYSSSSFLAILYIHWCPQCTTASGDMETPLKPWLILAPISCMFKFSVPKLTPILDSLLSCRAWARETTFFNKTDPYDRWDCDAETHHSSMLQLELSIRLDVVSQSRRQRSPIAHSASEHADIALGLTTIILSTLF